MTYFMPSIVREVSAMLVAMTTFRAPGGVGSKILACMSVIVGLFVCFGLC